MTGGGRHDDRSTGDGGQAGDDLVDLLYGELPPDEERAVRARVAGDPALMGKLSEMEGVRELMRGVADAEPPPHISAQLLAHAAQVTARGSRAQEAQAGFWTRLRSWMQPLIAHPGLAAATSLLVVAGVASVLLMRQGDDLTRARRSAAPPPAAEPTESAAEESAPALEPGAPAEKEEADKGYAGGQGAGVATGGDEGGSAPGPASDAPAPAVSADARRKSRSSSRREREGRAADKNASRDDSVDVGVEDGRVLGLTEQDSDQARGTKATEKPRPSDESADAESEAPAGQASPPPAPTSPPASSPSSSEPAPEPKQAAQPRELHERAVKAAANRRCLEVQSLGQAIRRADPAYHEKVFRGDKRLAVCLSSGRPAKGR